ncbi:LrgB family protein [Consotaella salsifontis]|uniref:TIGR00659 family protein n=1 Tax=Consotaella salsifontis TaxID=1365950 RepID=A0A1T4PRL5_9HYPH|nr:LrgB family protein [Consotaella salsifontis]SJZ94195.1 TIGR00659 family protein [Consotaella salsifontis]
MDTLSELQDIWAYLAASPLLSLSLTLVAYVAALALYRFSHQFALFHPLLVSILVIVAVLMATGTSYDTYFKGAQFVHFLLGPATVALAVPLYRQWDRIKRRALAICVSLFLGSVTAIASTLAIAALLGSDREIITSLAPKSVTTPVAMGIVEKLGGLPSLAAVFVLITGVLGATAGPFVLTLVGVTDERARGFGLGTASHGLGTARALQEGEAAGAFSGLAMGLNALLTAILLPLIWSFLF